MAKTNGPKVLKKTASIDAPKIQHVRRKAWPKGFPRTALNHHVVAWLDVAVQDGRIVNAWDIALYIGLECAYANQKDVNSSGGVAAYKIRANCQEVRKRLLDLKLVSASDMKRAYLWGITTCKQAERRLTQQQTQVTLDPNFKLELVEGPTISAVEKGATLPTGAQIESGALAGPSAGFQRAEKAWARPADDLGDFYNRVRTDMHSLDMEQAELIDRVLKPIRSDRLVAALATRPGTLGAVMAAQLLTIKKGEDYNAREVSAGKTGHSASRDDYFPFGTISYVQMIHIKSERLKNLVTKELVGGAPNNESLLDSTLDLINYASFLAEYLRRRDGGTEE